MATSRESTFTFSQAARQVIASDLAVRAAVADRPEETDADKKRRDAALQVIRSVVVRDADVSFATTLWNLCKRHHFVAPAESVVVRDAPSGAAGAAHLNFTPPEPDVVTAAMPMGALYLRNIARLTPFLAEISSAMRVGTDEERLDFIAHAMRIYLYICCINGSGKDRRQSMFGDPTKTTGVGVERLDEVLRRVWGRSLDTLFSSSVQRDAARRVWKVLSQEQANLGIRRIAQFLVFGSNYSLRVGNRLVFDASDPISVLQFFLKKRAWIQSDADARGLATTIRTVHRTLVALGVRVPPLNTVLASMAVPLNDTEQYLQEALEGEHEADFERLSRRVASTWQPPPEPSRRLRDQDDRKKQSVAHARVAEDGRDRRVQGAVRLRSERRAERLDRARDMSVPRPSHAAPANADDDGFEDDGEPTSMGSAPPPPRPGELIS